MLRWMQAGSAVVLALLTWIPTAWIESGPVLCPFRRFFGVECYGCGMTRALSALLHGRLDTAMLYNRGCVAAAALLLAMAVSVMDTEAQRPQRVAAKPEC